MPFGNKELYSLVVPSGTASVHSRVRAKTKPEAERVGKYMIRPVLALERLTFLEPKGKVGYRWGRDTAGLETMDYLELIARVTSHIPDSGLFMIIHDHGSGSLSSFSRGAGISCPDWIFGSGFRG